MNYRLDTNDAFHDDPFYDQREEERTERRHAYNPGPLEQAIDAGYDPADAAEGTY